MRSPLSAALRIMGTRMSAAAVTVPATAASLVVATPATGAVAALGDADCARFQPCPYCVWAADTPAEAAGA